MVLVYAVAIGASHALAGDSVSVAVTATVMPVCKFFSPSWQGGTPPVDPAIRYSCTNGTSPTFTMPPDARATCFACEGAVASSGATPGLIVVARGFGGDRTRAQIAIEQLIRGPYGQPSGQRAMTVTVEP